MTFIKYTIAGSIEFSLNEWNINISGADPGVEIGEGYMASAEREPIMGVWELCPQRGPGAEPLVRGSGGEAPLKLNAFWCCRMCEMALNCYVYELFYGH